MIRLDWPQMGPIYLHPPPPPPHTHTPRPIINEHALSLYHKSTADHEDNQSRITTPLELFGTKQRKNQHKTVLVARQTSRGT